MTAECQLEWILSHRLHGRRSRFAEAARLDELCRLRSIGDLARALR